VGELERVLQQVARRSQQQVAIAAQRQLRIHPRDDEQALAHIRLE